MDGFVSDLKKVRWQVSIKLNQSSIKSCLEFSMDTFTLKKLLFNAKLDLHTHLTKNYLRAMNLILYDLAPLTLVSGEL